jgi:hypothetical protein
MCVARGLLDIEGVTNMEKYTDDDGIEYVWCEIVSDWLTQDQAYCVESFYSYTREREI